MPDSKPRIYWDACVFLAYVNGDADRIDLLRQLLDEAREGRFELFTSMVSVTEVAYGRAEQEQGAPDEGVLNQIGELWLAGSPVRLVEFHRLIAETAREFVREIRLEESERLTPLDAVHLATARHLGVSEFHTYDGPLRSKGAASRFGFFVIEPRTDTPHIPGVR